MARTLGYLVASMTIGAAVLDWLEPNRPGDGTPHRQLIAQIREAIHQPAEGSALPHRWHTIRVEAQQSGGSAKETAAHFLVEADGHWAPTEYWNNQRPLGEDGVVRIGLRTTANTGQITQAQWLETRQLISSLQDMCHITRQGLKLSPTLALAPETNARNQVAQR